MEIKQLKLDQTLSQAEIIKRLKDYLKQVSAELRDAHKGPLGGMGSCQLRAEKLDYLFRAVLSVLPETKDGKVDELPISVVAVGGYGRGELNPFSDIDILILHPPGMLNQNMPDDELTSITDGILYKLWDCGLKVGHAVRTIDQCVHHAKEEMQSMTGLLEARFIGGNKNLFENLEAAIMKKCISGFEDEYMEMRLKDQTERRHNYGGSPFLQTPNVKNGCGGLRDFQNLLWMTYFKFRLRRLEDLVDKKALTLDECEKLKAAYDFLLKVRSELHYLENRPIDTLERANQHQLAKALKYPQRSMVRLIEAFMHDYYVHVRNIFLISRTAEKNLAIIKHKNILPTFKQVIKSRSKAARKQAIDVFIVSEGILECPNYQDVVDQPQKLMRLFLYVQKLGLDLHPSLESSIRNHVKELGTEFQSDPQIIETFLEIINKRGSVAPILRMMHELEVLGKFLPEFGKMTCLVQHEFLHQYTADEHTLVCIEHLDKIWSAKDKPHVKYQDVFRELENPFEIYLALLLHDCGKAAQGKAHEIVGARMMNRVGKRFGLKKSSLNRISKVVEHHLLIPVISQRRDLDDPDVIEEVAGILKSRRLLRILAIHTFCDSMGTSSSLWNEFKDMLLWQLYHKTYKVLDGNTEFLHLQQEEYNNKLKRIKRLAHGKLPQAEIKAHFDNLPEKYFTSTDPDEIVLDMELVSDFLSLQFQENQNPFKPIIHWNHNESRGYSTVKICTWNRKGFFAKLAGSVKVTGLTILSAQIYSRLDGIIIDTFVLVDATIGKIPNEKKILEFDSLLEESLSQDVQFEKLLKKKEKARPTGQSDLDAVIESNIRLRNDLSEQYNVIEVVAPDEPGLLFHLSSIISELNLDIWLAKVITERGAAIDTFYIAEVEGSKINDEEQLEFILNKLRHTLSNVVESFDPEKETNGNQLEKS